MFFALLPVAPLAKFVKITLRLGRRNPRALGRVAKELPLFSLGLLAYGAGQVSGALTPLPRSALADGEKSAKGEGRGIGGSPHRSARA
jgi:hypothetical protein